MTASLHYHQKKWGFIGKPLIEVEMHTVPWSPNSPLAVAFKLPIKLHLSCMLQFLSIAGLHWASNEVADFLRASLIGLLLLN